MQKKGNTNFLPLDELSKLFGVSSHTILSNQQREGFPKPQKGIYDVSKVVNWVISRPTSKKSKMWLAASRILSDMGPPESHSNALENDSISLEKPKKNSSNEKKSPKAVFLEAENEPQTNDLGAVNESQTNDFKEGDVLSQLKPTVAKLYSVVDSFADMANESLSEGNIEMSAYYTKMLVPSIEALRKGIESCLTVGKTLGSLLPMEEVQAAFTQMATNIRNQLLVMVKKLSHELVNMKSTGQVQRVLEEEVYEVLENLASNPFGT